MLLSLLRHRPPDVEPAVVFLADGPDEERARALGAVTAVVSAGRARHIWRAPRALRGLRGAIRAHAADVVFAHVSKAQLYAGPAAALEGVPELWWQHEWPAHAARMQALAARLPAAAVVCSSDRTAALQRTRSPRTPVIRIHPGVETGERGPRRHDRGGASVGIVGRLQRFKRVELALRSMPPLLARVPEARLRVVGGVAAGLDEDYPGELAALADRLGVGRAVEFAGHVPDGGAAIAGLDVLVHCAQDEPFGLVIVEAMVAGVPVVAPDHGGPTESVRHGVDGLLVDPTDAEALASAIADLLADPGRRAAMGAAGRQRALERFTASGMADEAWRVVRAVARREAVG